MTPLETADASVRRATGERKCGFKMGKYSCNKGKITGSMFYGEDATSFNVLCPNCHGTGYEPITIADVLMALQIIYKINCHTQENGIITFSLFLIEDSYNINAFEWSLTTDYHGQDEDTRLAIGRLLNK